MAASYIRTWAMPENDERMPYLAKAHSATVARAGGFDKNNSIARSPREGVEWMASGLRSRCCGERESRDLLALAKPKIHEYQNSLKGAFSDLLTDLHVFKMSGSDIDRAGEPLFEDFEGSSSPQAVSNSKRKRDPEEKQASKRRKLKRPKDVDDSALDAELGVNHAIARMDSQLLADHVAQRTQRFRPDLTLVEREEIHVPSMYRGVYSRRSRSHSHR